MSTRSSDPLGALSRQLEMKPVFQLRDVILESENSVKSDTQPTQVCRTILEWLEFSRRGFYFELITCTMVSDVEY